MRRDYILTLSCPNRIGIVFAVARFLAEAGWNIVDSAQFDDQASDRFFMRVAFEASAPGESLEGLRRRFQAVAADFAMDWRIEDAQRRARVVILVSRFDHCLHDLLYRHSVDELPIDIPAVVSNHEQARRLADHHGVVFHHWPVTPQTKADQEGRLLGLLHGTQADVLVLARYMQVLSDDLCARLPCPAINIHHSFLPSFKGARPYHQAHARGVKLIGATAHYVTPDLDEGPIIAQAVRPVTHAQTPDALVRVGRDVEKTVLAEALRLHIEQRVLRNGVRTVVFA